MGQSELAAGALSFVWCNVTGFSFIAGLMTSLDTLASQAYGSKRYALVGILLQRTWFLSFCALLPVVVLWQFSEEVLLLLWQDKTVSYLVGTYSRWMTIAMVPYILGEGARRYLLAQGIATPVFISRVIALAVSIAFAYVTIYVVKFGFYAAPFASIVYYMVNCGILFGIVKWRRLHEETWSGWSRDALRDIPYASLSPSPPLHTLCIRLQSRDLHDDAYLLSFGKGLSWPSCLLMLVV